MEKIIFITPTDFTPQTLRDAKTLLPPAETAPILRIRQESKRDLHLLTHYILRREAATLLSITPDELRLTPDALGKPFFPNFPDLAFSISYTTEAAVIALADHPVGIDIERIRTHHMKFVKNLGTASELSRLKAAPNDLLLFYEFWTRKEAWVKFTGKGLRTPLTSFDVWEGEACAHLRTWQENGCMISLCC